MMTPMFLNKTNTEYFDLSPEDRHQQVLERSPFYSSSISASGISSLHLEQGLGMSATHIMSDQSLTFDQLEGSKNTYFNMVLPTHGAQMTSTHDYGSQNHEILSFKQQEDQEPNSKNNSGGIATDNGSSLRWMTSKMRMMRKMINSSNTKSGPGNGIGIKSASNNPDHGPKITANIDTNIDNNGIRVCSDCNTTKTPLWRSGPQGPKTLCNACGIRQRKARKVAMEALFAGAAKNISRAAASSSTSSKTSIKLKINEENKSRAPSNSCVSKHINKKQTTPNKQEANQLVDSDHNSSSTTSNSSKRQMVFEEFAVNMLSKNAAFHRMFPKDEEEGALLLMALSFGLTET